uniref:THAP-type domain-containing protein n=1 Tax=Angiostrongylus cantonensis TaxID=6313 RepID=A0A158P9S0_ANGCA
MWRKDSSSVLDELAALRTTIFALIVAAMIRMSCVGKSDFIAMTVDNDVVLPSFTNVGEPTCVYSEDTTSSVDVSIIYSSIPPDINTESMSRATKSSVGGEMLRISKRPDGKLSIFACESDNTTSPSVYKRGHHSVCVVCHRNIADREMFLNFPDDLDRRRLWGNILGFKYSDMLRLRDGSVVLSTGHICTDHFAEECFRHIVFNFNKAAIEALGMPSVLSPGARLTPSRKWRIYEVSRANCRSSLLDPVMKWSSWTDRNVYLAYHGCEPPPRTPRKQPNDDVSTGSESPNRFNKSPEVLQNSPSSSNVDTSIKRTTRAERASFRAGKKMCEAKVTPRGGSNKTVVSDKITQSLPTQKRAAFTTSNRNARRSLLFPSSPVKNNVSGAVKTSKALSRPVLQLRKPVSPHGLLQSNTTTLLSNEHREKKTEKEISNDEKSRTVAKVILKATSAPSHTLVDALNLSSEGDGGCLPEDPAITTEGRRRASEFDDDELKAPAEANARTIVRKLAQQHGPLFLNNDVSDLSAAIFPEFLQFRQSKTQRQLESLEARLRIFGDCYGVEIPKGYSAIETRSGVRLVGKLFDEAFYAIVILDGNGKKLGEISSFKVLPEAL